MPLYSRFLRHEPNEFTASTQRVKHPAFMPNKEIDKDTKKTYLSKSIFNIDDLPQPDIWQLAELNVIGVKARGDILDAVIITTGLEIDFNNDPPRHANIIGWDNSENDMAREKNKTYVMKLAGSSRLVIR